MAGPDSDSGRWTTLSGADASDFRISNGGVLTFARTPDFETPADADENNVYLVTLNATDSERNMATRNVVVTVTDVEDTTTPVIGGTLLDRFDTDPDGVSGEIDKSEVIMAINDYLDDIGGVTKKDVIDVINLYLDS